MNDLTERRDRILARMLPHVGFDGWTRRALEAGARDAGHSAAEALLAFPGGMNEVAGHFSDYADRRMVAALGAAGATGATGTVREKIAAAVRIRLEGLANDKEAVRRLISYLSFPGRAGLAARCTYRTVDAIWYAIGDQSTDFNFYTKRGLLAAVYGATVLYWLTDASDGAADSWAFLDRRINDVLKIPKFEARVIKALSGLPSPLRALRRNPGGR